MAVSFAVVCERMTAALAARRPGAGAVPEQASCALHPISQRLLSKSDGTGRRFRFLSVPHRPLSFPGIRSQRSGLRDGASPRTPARNGAPSSHRPTRPGRYGPRTPTVLLASLVHVPTLNRSAPEARELPQMVL